MNRINTLISNITTEYGISRYAMLNGTGDDEAEARHMLSFMALYDLQDIRGLSEHTGMTYKECRESARTGMKTWGYSSTFADRVRNIRISMGLLHGRRKHAPVSMEDPDMITMRLFGFKWTEKDKRDFRKAAAESSEYMERHCR